MVSDLAVLLLQFLDPANPVHDRGVVAPSKPTADLGQRAGSELFRKIHGDLTRASEGADALRTNQVREADVEVLADLALDFLDRDLAIRRAQHVRQAVLRQFHRDLATDQRRKCKEAHQGSLKHAHVAGDSMRQEFEDALLNPQVWELFGKLLDLLLEYAKPKFVIGRMHVHNEPRLQSAHDPVIYPVYVRGGAVRTHDDLPFLVNQGVERVKELFLRRVLASDELDIVDHQDVDRTKELLERNHVLVAKGLDKPVHELLRRKVNDVQSGRSLAQFPGNCLHQVRLAQANAAVEKERVERRGTALCHPAGRRVRQFVRLADDKALEREPRIERRAGHFAADMPGHGTCRLVLRLGRALPSRFRSLLDRKLDPCHLVPGLGQFTQDVVPEIPKHPVAHEGGRHVELGDAAFDPREFKRFDPVRVIALANG